MVRPCLEQTKYEEKMVCDYAHLLKTFGMLLLVPQPLAAMNTISVLHIIIFVFFFCFALLFNYVKLKIKCSHNMECIFTRQCGTAMAMVNRAECVNVRHANRRPIYQNTHKHTIPYIIAGHISRVSVSQIQNQNSNNINVSSRNDRPVHIISTRNEKDNEKKNDIIISTYCICEYEMQSFCSLE